MEKMTNGILVTATPEQNVWDFENSIFKTLLLNENYCILFRILPEFVWNATVDNISTLVEAINWRRTGDKLLFEPLMRWPPSLGRKCDISGRFY